MTTCAQAIKNWETANSLVAEEADFVKIYCQMPPITKMDSALIGLKNCERLALSSNSIDRMISLSGMSKLRILSLGRNVIKKIEKLEDISSSLEELWISYNQITTLDGLSCCPNLTTLYISNNQLKQWSELDKLAGLANLRDVLFVGNPIYDDMAKEAARIEVLRRLPNVAKIDGDMVKPTERELAATPA
jgi:dynein light chain 1